MSVLVRWGAAVVLTAGALGCVPSVVEQRSYSPPRPALDERSHASKEKREVPPEAVATLSDNTVDVEVHQRAECRTLTTTPMVQDIEVSRSIPKTAQWENVGAAVLLAGAGAVVAFDQCTQNGTNTTTGQPNPCTSDQLSTQQDIGYTVMGLAAIPAALLVVNAIRAQDTTTTERTAPLVQGDWETCETEPLGVETIVRKRGVSIALGAIGGRCGRESACPRSS